MCEGAVRRRAGSVCQSRLPFWWAPRWRSGCSCCSACWSRSAAVVVRRGESSTTACLMSTPAWLMATAAGSWHGTCALLCLLLTQYESSYQLPGLSCTRTLPSPSLIHFHVRQVCVCVYNLCSCARSNASIPRYREVGHNIYLDRPVGHSNYGKSGVQTSAL